MDKKETKKRKIIKVENSLGGSLILRIGCPFSADSIATVFEYIYTGFFETQEHFTGFANYVIEPICRLSMIALNSARDPTTYSSN